MPVSALPISAWSSGIPCVSYIARVYPTDQLLTLPTFGVVMLSASGTKSTGSMDIVLDDVPWLLGHVSPHKALNDFAELR